MNERQRWPMYQPVLRAEKVFFDRLNGREAAQWLFVVGLMYALLNWLPGDITIKAILCSLLLAGGWFFIHYQINGLVGYEKVYVMLRFRLERTMHDTIAADTSGIILPPGVQGAISPQRRNRDVTDTITERQQEVHAARL